MTGRARGRSRGRGRATQQEPPQPGSQPAPVQPSQGGRGRSRGAAPPPQQAPAPAAAAPPPQAKVPTEQMKKMAVTEEKPSEERQQKRRLGESREVTKYKSEGVSKEGTSGTVVNIVSNYFKVQKLPKFGLFQYNVAFDPEIQSIKLKKALLYNMEEILGATRCFDGMTMFLPIKLADTVTTKTVKTNSGNDITISITFTNVVPENSPSHVQLMNILFRKQLKAMKMELVGRNYYNPNRKIEVKAHKMVVWPGLSTSILQYEKDVMLCADISFKVLRQQSVLEYLYELYNSVPSQRFHETVAQKLVGSIVLTRYNNKTYRVDDIDWNKNPTHTFEKGGRDPKQISFKEYYETMYEKPVKDLKQPLLVSKPKDKDKKRGMSGPILLLPEFCVITGLSDEMRANFSVMKDLAVHTRISPAARAQNLEQFRQELETNPEAKKEFNQWNLSFEPHLLKMTGRTLAPEAMMQRQDKFTYKAQDADWSRETRGKALISTVHMDKWVLLYTQRDQNTAQDFKQTLQKVCGPMGMNVSEPSMCRLNSDSSRDYVEALKEQIKPDTKIVVCIVPNNRGDRYNAIKKLCCVERPVPSQVVVSRTLSKKQMLMSVCTKIGIQLNCKLGGEVWAVDIPIKKAMVVGFDVYHDSLNKGKSVGGFVASTNVRLTQYYSRITHHSSLLEICSQLKVCMTGALKEYHKINGYLPDRVFFYRDGVGDGQLREVYDHEMPQLEAAFKAVQENYAPKFSMIIVKKRVSTRLILESGGQYSNPMPGTVVDRVVTRPEWFDFFLVSQSVRQGTVTPTHYNIVRDTSGMKAEHFQRLTYKLCHLYYNWPGTIRVPAPCQYAHKLAFLVGQSIHTEPDVQLADRLYYL